MVCIGLKKMKKRALPLLLIKDILKLNNYEGLLKTVGKVTYISRLEENSFLKIKIVDENSEILLRIYDTPKGFMYKIMRTISISDYVLVIGYLKYFASEPYGETSNNSNIYILVKALKRISEERYHYYKLRYALNNPSK